MKELHFFLHNGELKEEVQELILNKDIREKYSTIKEYCQSYNLLITQKDLEKLTQGIESIIYRDLNYFCYLSFYIMCKTGDWGDAGENQVKISFCRNLLGIAADTLINTDDIARFTKLVDRKLTALDIEGVPIEKAKEFYENFSFKLFKKEFSIHDVLAVDEILRFVCSSWILQGGCYGYERQFILASGTVEKKGIYKVINFINEILRTPNTIMAMAAIIGEKKIYIRHESLCGIYFQKWVCFFKDEYWENFGDIYRKISRGIKLKAFQYYGVKDEDHAKKVQPQFVKDMGSTILHHELGHGIIQYQILPMLNGAISEASRIFGENILTAFLEVLADFAPETDDGARGPIKNMQHIAKTDVDRALGMYYMYFSDTWFFDTNDEYMYLYSEIMALLLSYYLNDDTTVDFKSMFKKGPLWIDFFGWMIDAVCNISNELNTIARYAIYNIDDKTLNFEKLSMKIKDQFKEEQIDLDEGCYSYETAFWASVMDALKNNSDQTDVVMELLKEERVRILRGLFELVAGEEKASHFCDSRDYIIQRFKDIKII